MTDAFTHDDYAELLQRLRAATDDKVTAILSNNFNVVLGALAALPLIRADVLEEAAKVAEDDVLTLVNKHKIAAAIRALKEQP
jgi:DNA-binding LacI/PurR family transcriptional regulator